MHQTRQEMTPRLPLPRKGTKYVVRALSNHNASVPVLIALRDMLHLARTRKEVQEMIKKKLLKINDRLVEDPRESIQLYGVLEAGKRYHLTLSPTRKFVFEIDQEKSLRLCKIIGKRIVKGKKIQFNLHDGTNLLSKEQYAIGDSLYLDAENKIKKHRALEKGADAAIIFGKYAGTKGKITSIEQKKVKITIEGRTTLLEQRSIIVL